MWQVIFLMVLGIVWILFAVIEDLRKREVANWLNYSLIIFALGFRFFYSLFSDGGFEFFYQGLIGLGIFFVLGNVLYYSKVFAGGDAKLMMALGAVLPFTESFFENVNIFVLFFFLFLVAGSIYGLIVSISLGIKNSQRFKKEFVKRFKKSKPMIYLSLVLAIIFLVLSFLEFALLYLGIISFIMPYLYLGAKSVDEACMIKNIGVNKLTEGDWLYKSVKVGKKEIKANWDGLTKKDIALLQKHKKNVLIRQGIPFTPSFLISFLVLIFLWFKGISGIFLFN